MLKGGWIYGIFTSWNYKSLWNNTYSSTSLLFKVFSAKGAGNPTPGWSWQRLQFNKSGSYWTIYNPFHKRYLQACTQKGLGEPLGSCEQFHIYRIVNGQNIKID